jgi:hypothetical protein
MRNTLHTILSDIVCKWFSEVRVTRSLVLCVCFVDRCLFVCPFLFFWPLCCVSYFDLRILITPLVSSNYSYSRSVVFSRHSCFLNDKNERHNIIEIMLNVTRSKHNKCFLFWLKLVNMTALFRKLQCLFLLGRAIHCIDYRNSMAHKILSFSFFHIFRDVLFSTIIPVLMHYDNESSGLFVFRVLNLCVMH